MISAISVSQYFSSESVKPARGFSSVKTAPFPVTGIAAHNMDAALAARNLTIFFLILSSDKYTARIRQDCMLAKCLNHYKIITNMF